MKKLLLILFVIFNVSFADCNSKFNEYFKIMYENDCSVNRTSSSLTFTCGIHMAKVALGYDKSISYITIEIYNNYNRTDFTIWRGFENSSCYEMEFDEFGVKIRTSKYSNDDKIEDYYLKLKNLIVYD